MRLRFHGTSSSGDLPLSSRDLPAICGDLRLELRCSPRRRHHGTEASSRGRAATGSGQRTTALREAVRFDAWFPRGQRGILRRAVPPHPGGGPRGGTRRRRRDGPPTSPWPSIPCRRGGETAPRLLESYYSAPAQVIMKRQATYAGPVEAASSAAALDRVGGAPHLPALAGGDQLARWTSRLAHIAEAQVDSALSHRAALIAALRASPS